MRISKLVSYYAIEDIEKALVIKYNSSRAALLLDNDVSEHHYKITSELPALSLFDLVNAFEQLVPKSQRKQQGVFFTPQAIAEKMITPLTATDKIIDLSCGSGVFLLAAFYQLKQAGVNEREIIEQHLFGIDILPENIRRCKFILQLACEKHYPDLKFNLYVHDALDEEFIEQFHNQFDLVIGNPPYVKYQDLSLFQRNSHYHTMQQGNSNLYFAFFEIGLKCLKESGELRYLTPNSYFSAQTAKPLRQLLTGRIKQIFDFKSQNLFNAQAFVCITYLQKQANLLAFCYETAQEKYRVAFQDLDIKHWQMHTDLVKTNLEKITSQPYKLSDLVEIKVGVATCKDEIYLTDDSLLMEGKYPIEEAITRRIVNETQRIIFPYKEVNGKNVPYTEDELQEHFPQCYAYLLTKKDVLATRDKGLKTYPVWFAYARSQGIQLEQEKLWTPRYSRHPRFVYDNEKRLFVKGYGLVLKQNAHLSLSSLQKILNSPVMEYYIKHTSQYLQGDYYSYQKSFIMNFGIPACSDQDVEQAEIVDIYRLKLA